MWQLQVMRVESTDGQRQVVGLYLTDSYARQVLKSIRDLQPLKPWQFAGGKPVSDDWFKIDKTSSNAMLPV